MSLIFALMSDTKIMEDVQAISYYFVSICIVLECQNSDDLHPPLEAW